MRGAYCLTAAVWLAGWQFPAHMLSLTLPLLPLKVIVVDVMAKVNQTSYYNMEVNSLGF